MAGRKGNSVMTDSFRYRELIMIETIYCVFLIVLGIVGGVSSTYAAMVEIIDTQFITPCYLQWFQ